MADSRLTDLPSFTEIDNDDVLYIVDISQDASNKITYRNLVGNKIEALSATINNLSIPDIDQLTTNIATVSVIQFDKADQSSLNDTNARVTTLESDNTTNKNNIAINDLDIDSLSAYIDQKAPLSAVNVFNTNIDALSTAIDVKADITSVQLKTNQSQTDSLSTVVFNLSSQVGINIEDINNVDVIVDSNSTSIDTLSTDLYSLSTESSERYASNHDLRSLSGLVVNQGTDIDNLEAEMRIVSAAFIKVPFNNVSIDSNTSFLTTFNDLSGTDKTQPVEPNILGNTVTSYISSASLNRYISFEGLITQTVIVSSGSIEFNAFNPTGNTISFDNLDLIMYVDNGIEKDVYPDN